MLVNTTVPFTEYERGLKGRAQREKDRQSLANDLLDRGIESRLVGVRGIPCVVIEYAPTEAATVGEVLAAWSEGQ